MVVAAACGGSPTPVAPHVEEPTGPELVAEAPGATAFAVDGSAVYWIATGSGEGVWKLAAGSATKLADVGDDARAIALGRELVYWNGGNAIRQVAKTGGAVDVFTDTGPPRNFEGWPQAQLPIRTFALHAGHIDMIEATGSDSFYWTHWVSPRVGAGEDPVVGTDPVIAVGSDIVIGTSSELEQPQPKDGVLLHTPIDGGVRALAVDGDDVFFGNTTIFEKYGRAPVRTLGPAGGPVTAMAVDPAYVYWAIAAGDRDPAIYRAKRANPELELVTRVGSASQLIVGGDFLYWLDPVEGAIHRIKRRVTLGE